MRLRLRSSKQLRFGLAALGVVALLLPGLRASAQTKESTDEFGEDAKPAKPAKSAEAEAPADGCRDAARAAGGTRAGAGIGAVRPVRAAPEPPARRELERQHPVRHSRAAAIRDGGRTRRRQDDEEHLPAPVPIHGRRNALQILRVLLPAGLAEPVQAGPWRTDGVRQERSGSEHPGRLRDVQAPRNSAARTGGSTSRSTPGSCCRRSPTTAWRARRSSTARTTSSTAYRRNVTSIADPFRSAGQSPLGRDAGVQLRALVLNGHIDFRAGVFMGHRLGAVPAVRQDPAVVGGLNPFRLAARLQINLLDARARVLLPGHLSRREEDPFDRRLLRLPGHPSTSILAATSSSICPSAPGSSPRRPTSCSGTAGPSDAVARSPKAKERSTWARWAISSDRSC